MLLAVAIHQVPGSARTSFSHFFCFKWCFAHTDASVLPGSCLVRRTFILPVAFLRCGTLWQLFLCETFVDAHTVISHLCNVAQLTITRW